MCRRWYSLLEGPAISAANGQIFEETRTVRRPFDPQLRLGGCSIAAVEVNLKCRDEIIPILAALQYIYSMRGLRDSILELVARDVNGSSSSRRGRKGMTYWQILVLAAVRLGCNLDYDKLQDLAEQHRTLRLMMGLSRWDEHVDFDWRRIQDNLCKLKAETITAISNLIVKEGHRLVPDAAKSVRGDSFACRTNVHYPTDSSLIGDGLRKILDIAPDLAEAVGAAGWRQHKHLRKKLRRMLRRVGQACASRAADREKRRQDTYRNLFALAKVHLARAVGLHQQATAFLTAREGISHFAVEEQCRQLAQYVLLTEKVLGYAYRRVILGEKVPNHEKLFSVFETYTQLIHRGTKRDPIEFARRILVIEDAVGFVCHHKVMEVGEEDVDALVPEMLALQERLEGRVEHASFDRGFHSPENQIALAQIVRHPCIPKKGKRQGAEQEREATIEFRAARQRHPGIESGIGALGSGNGLERCRDRTFAGYKRYVALGVLGRNLHVLGKIVIARTDATAPAAYSKRKRAAA